MVKYFNTLSDFKGGQEVLINLGEGYVLRKVDHVNYKDSEVVIDMGNYLTGVSPQSLHKPPRTMLVIKPVRG